MFVPTCPVLGTPVLIHPDGLLAVDVTSACNLGGHAKKRKQDYKGHFLGTVDVFEQQPEIDEREGQRRTW